MPTYYSIITNNGLINHANASANEVNLDLAEMAVGDSNGVYYDPDGTETALQNELYRVDLTHVVIDENNPNQLIVEAVLDEVVGPFYIREVGIFDSNGDLFAIGKFPETFKPNLPSGSGKRLYIRMILGFASSPNVNLIINNDISLDPNFSTDVNNALSERLIKTNNLSDLNNISDARDNLGLGIAALAGDSTESEKGIVQIATQAEVNAGINSNKLITPAKLLGLFNSSNLSTDSYARIPIKNGSSFDEMIIQFGTMSTGSGWRTETLPLAFPNAFIWVQPLHIASSHRNFNVNIISNSQFSVEAISVPSTSVRYMAIGY